MKAVNHARRLTASETFNVMGPTVELLTGPTENDHDSCLMKGTIPVGGVIPLHSHADPETFIVVSGDAEALSKTLDSFAWIPLGPGDVFHVPGNAPHAFRNRGPAPATMVILSTSKIGRFFREIGTRDEKPVRPPSPEMVERFLRTAARYGYWNATPEENARVGIALVPPG